MSLVGVDAVVGKLVSRRGGRDEMATVSSMRSTVNSPEVNEAEETKETIVRPWRSRPVRLTSSYRSVAVVYV